MTANALLPQYSFTLNAQPENEPTAPTLMNLSETRTRERRSLTPAPAVLASAAAACECF